MKSYLFNLALLALIVALGGWASHVSDVQGRQGRQAHDALCVLKSDIQKRVDQSALYLVEHPKGIPGISPTLLRNSIENQQKTLDALRRSGLTCG